MDNIAPILFLSERPFMERLVLFLSWSGVRAALMNRKQGGHICCAQYLRSELQV